MAVVNCLNFGNPEHPEVMWQLSEAIDGMAEACLALDLPVIGGNVSLYNESDGSDIDPTPVIGALGIIDRLAARPPGSTLVAGGSLVLLDASVGTRDSGHRPPSLAGSRWAVQLRRHRNGTLPSIDLAAHHRLVTFVATLVAEGVAGRDGLIDGIHDVSGGGIGVTLAELAVRSGVGVRASGVADHHELFTEAPSRVVVCTTRSHELLSRVADAGVGFRVLGTAGGDGIVIDDLVDLDLVTATAAWRGRLPGLLDDLAPVTN
jgi:phosphoribosylformylglycinamidine synthase